MRMPLPEKSFGVTLQKIELRGVDMLSSIKTVVTNHFKVLVRDMDNQPFDKFNSSNLFNNALTILMSFIVESHKLAIII